MTALQGAAANGTEAIIQFLVDKGADVNQMDSCGQTALSVALGDPEGLVNRSDRHKVSQTRADLLKRLGADASIRPLTPQGACQTIRHNAIKDIEYGDYAGSPLL